MKVEEDSLLEETKSFSSSSLCSTSSTKLKVKIFTTFGQGRSCGAGDLRRHSKRGPIVYKFFFFYL